MGKLVKSFEDLIAWQRAMDLAASVYELSRCAQFKRDFALADQIHRSAISIPSNIAEGFERGGRREFRYFLSVAKASCAELMTQVHLAARLGYVNEQERNETVAVARDLSRIIGKLRSSINVTTRHPSLVTNSVTRH